MRFVLQNAQQVYYLKLHFFLFAITTTKLAVLTKANCPLVINKTILWEKKLASYCLDQRETVLGNVITNTGNGGSNVPG